MKPPLRRTVPLCLRPRVTESMKTLPFVDQPEIGCNGILNSSATSVSSPVFRKSWNSTIQVDTLKTLEGT